MPGYQLAVTEASMTCWGSVLPGWLTISCSCGNGSLGCVSVVIVPCGSVLTSAQLCTVLFLCSAACVAESEKVLTRKRDPRFPGPESSPAEYGEMTLKTQTPSHVHWDIVKMNYRGCSSYLYEPGIQKFFLKRHINVVIKVAVNGELSGSRLSMLSLPDDLMLSCTLSPLAVGLPPEGAGGWSSGGASPAFHAAHGQLMLLSNRTTPRATQEPVAALWRGQWLQGTKMAQPKFLFFITAPCERRSCCSGG